VLAIWFPYNALVINVALLILWVIYRRLKKNKYYFQNIIIHLPKTHESLPADQCFAATNENGLTFV